MRSSLIAVTLIGAVSIAAAPNKERRIEPPPIVRTTVAPPTWRYSNWMAADMDSFTIASTENESGSAFGVICGSDCVWFVNFRTPCTSGNDYPAMINAPSGSSPIELRCYKLDERWLLTFKVDDASIDMLAKGGEVGFAFPLESGKFGVSRFSLSGGSLAVKKAVDLIQIKQNSKQEGLRDFTI